jgi:hypothetical protein
MMMTMISALPNGACAAAATAPASSARRLPAAGRSRRPACRSAEPSAPDGVPHAPPPENQKGAAVEIAKGRERAGEQGTDNSPRGGSGYEPQPADGEGEGYNMAQVAKEARGDEPAGDANKRGGRPKDVGEAADVGDVE